MAKVNRFFAFGLGASAAPDSSGTGGTDPGGGGSSGSAGTITDHPTLSNGLIAYWNLDEASGDRADSVGTYTLTPTGTVGSEPGVIDNQATFTSNSYLENASLATALTNISFSFSFWFELSNSSSGPAIFGWWQKSNSNGTFLLFLSQSKLLLSVRPSTSLVSDVVVNDNQKYHVVYTYNETTEENRLYLDNVLISSQNAAINETNNPILFGSRGGDFGMEGAIDEVALYNRVLTEAEVADLYNSGAGISH